MKHPGLGVFFVFILATASLPWAQSTDGNRTPSQPTKPSVMRIESVVPGAAGLGFKRVIRIHVEGWTPPADQADATKRGAEYLQWVLYLDGRPISKLHPTSVDVYQGDFHFEMKRSQESAEAWRLLFKQVSFWPFSRATELTIGPEIGGSPVEPKRAIETTSGAFNLVLIPLRRFFMLAFAYAALAVVVFLLAHRSNILRAPAAPGTDLPTPRDRPYSLGRTQMATWFMVVLAAYLFLGLFTDDWTQSLNASTLGLMGIAAATALGAQAIDTKKEDRAASAAPQVQALQTQAGALNDAIKGAPSGDVVASITSELNRVNTRLSQAKIAVDTRRPKSATRSFWRDLVTDDGGVGLHRVQIVVWTITLCGAFLYLVGRDLSMPSFDPTLLTLIGISSGTYLGFKYPER